MAVDPNIKILIADDSGTMRIMFKQMLNKAGFENIAMAVDGEDGIQKVQEEQPEIIISDWNMPRMDGLEFLKWLRVTKPYKDIPFIMATAQADKGQQLAVMEAGGNGHVPKPFDAEQIKRAIYKVMAPETMAESSGAAQREMRNGKVVLNVAHIQITDHLALGALKHRIEIGEIIPRHFELKTERNPDGIPYRKGSRMVSLTVPLCWLPLPWICLPMAHRSILCCWPIKRQYFVRSRHYDPRLIPSEFYKYKVVDIPHKCLSIICWLINF